MPKAVPMTKTEWLVFVAETCKTQADMADWYAIALREVDRPAAEDDEAVEPIDWPTVNEAVVTRWSVTGLTRVKDAAWKQVGRG